MTWKVKFFQTVRGDYPVRIFIEKQTSTTHAKIIRTIELLENYGPFLKPPYYIGCKPKSPRQKFTL